MALLRHSGLRFRSSGVRGEADVQRTCSELPSLTRTGSRTDGAGAKTGPEPPQQLRATPLTGEGAQAALEVFSKAATHCAPALLEGRSFTSHHPILGSGERSPY